MRIEFRTVYDSIENEKMGQLYAKHCIDKQLKQLKTIRTLLLIICLLGIGFCAFLEFAKDIYFPAAIFTIFGIFGALYCDWVKKKLYPKIFTDVNGIGCPYNVTFGLYDEYFYEKFENNMSISEQSTRYEFLKKVVETPECFILMTKRSQLYFLPKRDMGYEAALEFSGFCKARLPYIYKAVI
ncbi:MAG: YcxB family protein [Clostridia bacterium]|nr:YcxB family protein [Clostridia bacterium]